ncbi:ATP-binding cassette domain-containing protein [Ruania halotolerans]|uniref:ATP-binding cassette domain-containing protein n=1 Tax=Ruania halotolerans TaxID=2897773 RepID=UPI001E603372|nr:ATP-binding cassette domain-containing protein [Ruania halotolerans]UFU05410.1 ATP-binding cassette domain-containing protein [Ruania halotolerans]
MQAAIDVRGLRKSFGEVEVLGGVDLRVGRGTVHALLGPNGAGKTTLVTILATLVRPDAGTVHVAGADLVDDPAEVRRRIALTGQAAAVDEVLTADENLRMMAGLHGLRGRAARKRSADLIERFGLCDAAHRRVKTYSGGMRRRLDLALSLIVAVPVVFLDEPTTGLDPRSRRELWEVIRSLRHEGITVLMTTQYLEEADELADIVSILGEGRIVAEGTPAELKRAVGEDLLEVRDRRGVVVHAEPTDGTSAGLRRALDAIDELGVTGELVVRRPTLDDVFFSLTGHGGTDTHELATTGRSHS